VDGAVRIASVVAVVLLVVVLIVWILRRRSRTDSDYTAAP
jgi:Na+/proline symporter